MQPSNAFYAQSGGPTAVINATACGVIEKSRQFSKHIDRLLAGQNGILGALEESLIDTTSLDQESLQKLRHTPGAAFGSCRYKLDSFASKPFLYERILEVFKAHNIHYLLYNGGEDSQDTVYKLGMYSDSIGYPLTCVGIPKTIDNDILCTDNCPGFGSVAKYIATSVLEVDLDMRAMHKSSTKVFILEVMGRASGWIAAAAGLATPQYGLSPHLILFPEVPFNVKFFLDKVAQTIEKFGYCIVIAAEGIRDLNGHFLSATHTKDAFSHVQLGGVAPKLAELIQQSLHVKHHWAVLDYLQRSAAHMASQTDVEQAYALGQAAIECAVQRKHLKMPILVRQSHTPYAWTIGETDLQRVANQSRVLPSAFIQPEGFQITDQCREYLTPLIQGESYPAYREGLPDYWLNDQQPIPKRLPAFNQK